MRHVVHHATITIKLALCFGLGFLLMNSSCTSPDLTPRLATITLSSPSDKATNQLTMITLSWTATYSSDGGAVSYDIYLDETTNPTTKKNTTTLTNLALILENSKTYYWKVTGKNSTGQTTTSSIQSFTTGSLPSVVGSMVAVFPLNLSTAQPTVINLSWNAATSSDATAVSYDVYLDQTPNPTAKITTSSIATNNFTTTALETNKKYYWKVIAKNTSNQVLSSQINSFTTDAYASIKIGGQVWMMENLNVSSYKNGDNIKQVKTNVDWKNAVKNNTQASCYYNYDSVTYSSMYGRMYNAYVLADTRGIIPTGWHIPTVDEWNTVILYLGGKLGAGKKLKHTTGWNNKTDGSSGNGDNSSGMKMLGSGMCDTTGVFKLEKDLGYWWTSTPNTTNSPQYYFSLYANDDFISNGFFNKGFGCYIRLVKD